MPLMRVTLERYLRELTCHRGRLTRGRLGVAGDGAPGDSLLLGVVALVGGARLKSVKVGKAVSEHRHLLCHRF